MVLSTSTDFSKVPDREGGDTVSAAPPLALTCLCDLGQPLPFALLWFPPWYIGNGRKEDAFKGHSLKPRIALTCCGHL